MLPLLCEPPCKIPNSVDNLALKASDPLGPCYVCLVAQSSPALCNPVDSIAHQSPLSLESSKQEYWSRLLFATPGDLPSPRIKPMPPASPALARGYFHYAAWETPWGPIGGFFLLFFRSFLQTILKVHFFYNLRWPFLTYRLVFTLLKY